MQLVFRFLLLSGIPAVAAAIGGNFLGSLQCQFVAHDHQPRLLEDQNPSFMDPNTDNDSSGENTHGSFEEVGVINLDFNPSFVVYDMFDSGPGLTVSSFFNVAVKNVTGMIGGGGGGNSTGGRPSMPPFVPFEHDLVAIVTDLDSDQPVVDIITDNVTTDTVWPNEAKRAPFGTFPFEAVVVPEGWFTHIDSPGRLVAIDIKTEKEYIIHQSTSGDPNFYHSIQFIDMDNDGIMDILTARSGYSMGTPGDSSSFSPPTGDLVWFQNPGSSAILDLEDNNNTNAAGWEEFIIVNDIGPDSFLDAKDMTGNGIPEIVATHFFPGLPAFDNTPFDSVSKITIYGAPLGEDWTAVKLSSDPNPTTSGIPPRVATIVDNQGIMFSVEIVDLDGDGRLDILATNHQYKDDPIAGRVLGLERPATDNLFEDYWIPHVLMDGIRPSPAPPGFPNFRMSPGIAQTFQPPATLVPEDDSASIVKPWIVVSGDQASKAWILKPTNNKWEYESELLLDINEYYGANTTSTMMRDPFGISISTIGEIGIRADESSDHVVLYVPVFEAMDIHIFQSAIRERNESESSSAGVTTKRTATCKAGAIVVGLMCMYLTFT